MTGCIRPERLLRLSATALALVVVLLLGGCASVQDDRASSAQASDAYTRLGSAYLERNNLPRATTALNRALEFSPHNAEALQALALVQSRQGDHQLADRTFRQALDAAPDMTQARNNYAVFLYQQGRIADACKQFKQASGDSHYAHQDQLLDNLDQCQRRLTVRNAASDPAKDNAGQLTGGSNGSLTP